MYDELRQSISKLRRIELCIRAVESADAPKENKLSEPIPDKTWQQFQEIVRSEWTDSTDKKRSSLLQLLRRYGAQVKSVQDAEVALSRISRGRTQVQMACDWNTPIVGGTGENPTRTEKARGWQWRHVIAFAGFEIFLRGLRDIGNGIHEKDYSALVNQATDLGRPPTLPAPDSDRAELARWISDGAEQEIIPFLGTRGELAKLLESVLIHETSPNDWTDILRLSAVLRHVTAHGSLSATKTNRWGLIPLYQVLPGELQKVVAATLRTLVKANA